MIPWFLKGRPFFAKVIWRGKKKEKITFSTFSSFFIEAFIGNRYVDLFVCDYDVIAARISRPTLYPNPALLASAHHTYHHYIRSLYPLTYPPPSVLDQSYPLSSSARYATGYGFHQSPSCAKGYYGEKLGYPPSPSVTKLTNEKNWYFF